MFGGSFFPCYIVDSQLENQLLEKALSLKIQDVWFAFKDQCKIYPLLNTGETKICTSQNLQASTWSQSNYMRKTT